MKYANIHKLNQLIHDAIKSFPERNIGQFLITRLTLAWEMGYEAGKQERQTGGK